MKKNVILLLLVFLFLPPLWAQNNKSNTDTSSNQFDVSGFPQWVRDLRRIEVITFGAFPFAYFFTNFGVDTYRWATNGWDRRYAPWPFDAAGSVDKTQDERFMTLGLSVGTAFLIALIDYTIVLVKRGRKERESRILPPGTPIIIRKPLQGEEGESPGSQDSLETGTP